jgi:glucokinase
VNLIAGIDIGGTKCAVSLGRSNSSGVELIEKTVFPTQKSPDETICIIIQSLKELVEQHSPGVLPDVIGISCGGPLDLKNGLVLSPPNLPDWTHVDLFSPIQKAFPVPIGLQNDANACALAEWKWGAGRGSKNMVFLTFGTGMGAGLILNGKLYTGANDMAGEIGHIRLSDTGPMGYGKPGSFEGYCSGGGIANLAREMAREELQRGLVPGYCSSLEDLDEVSAEIVGAAAQKGDPLALEVFHIVAQKLGLGLAVLVDILNPECIIIGSIYKRQQELLEPVMLDVLRKEAHPVSLGMCKVIPSSLGDQVGDLASLSVAMAMLESESLD